MKNLKVLMAIALFGCGATANAACSYPSAPEDLPTGDSESKEQMIAAQKQVKSYVAAMEEYLACLDSELGAQGEEVSDEQKLMRDKRYNAAVDVMDATAAQFNQAVRNYKARGK
ncbi:MAG: hypothetical protein AB8G16_00625 [Gammaproteobacteria bacterium]